MNLNTPKLAIRRFISYIRYKINAPDKMSKKIYEIKEAAEKLKDLRTRSRSYLNSFSNFLIEPTGTPNFIVFKDVTNLIEYNEKENYVKFTFLEQQFMLRVQFPVSFDHTIFTTYRINEEEKHKLIEMNLTMGDKGFFKEIKEQKGVPYHFVFIHHYMTELYSVIIAEKGD